MEDMSRSMHVLSSPAPRSWMVPIEVTVVVPARDEEDSIPVLAKEIEAVLDGVGLPWECLWIDDGSSDCTLERMVELRRCRREHRVLGFDQNYGQSAALAAGFRAAAGRIIATLDADLQNDPREIPRLLDLLDRTGADMINGYRVKREDSWVRRASSRIANAFRNRMTGERVRDVGCSLRVFRRECVQDILLFRGMHRFLPTLVRMGGYRMVEAPVSHRPRRFGRTKYGIGNRLWIGILDTLGVRWMESRTVRPRVRYFSDAEAREP